MDTLFLNGCKMHMNRLPEGAFRGLGNLQHLHIDSNVWTEPDYNGRLFADLTGLLLLEIDGIDGADFSPEFSNMTRLHDLIVHGGFVTITNSTFEAFATTPVEMVTIAAPADLRAVEPMSFAYFGNLKTLKLNDNQLLGLRNASVAFYGLRLTPVSSLFLNDVEPDDGRNINLDAQFFLLLNG